MLQTQSVRNNCTRHNEVLTTQGGLKPHVFKKWKFVSLTVIESPVAFTNFISQDCPFKSPKP